MFGVCGYLVLVYICGQYLGLFMIVVFGYEEVQVVCWVLVYGVLGYILKFMLGDEIVRVIYVVFEGDIWLLYQLVGGEIVLKNDEVDIVVWVVLFMLQQFCVLMMIVEGQFNKQIVWDLGVFEVMVKVYMIVIMCKFGVNNCIQVVFVVSQLVVDLGVMQILLDDEFE